jgi:hypothetical protein
MAVSEDRRLKELEGENSRLEKQATCHAIDIRMFKEIGTKPGTHGARRRVVKHHQERFGRSQRRRYNLASLAFSSLRFKEKWMITNRLGTRLQTLASESRHWGYRRMNDVPGREGTPH